MTFNEAMQNEALTNPRMLRLAFQAIKELGKFVTVEKAYQHVLSKLQHKENIIDRPESIEQLKDAIRVAKKEA